MSYETFKEFFTYSNLMQTYFLSIYGKEGEEPVAEETIKSTLSEKFVLADVLIIGLTDDSGNALSDEKVAGEKSKLEGYKKRLDNGEDFKTIYEEVNGKQQSTSTDSKEEKPEDELAQVLGAEDTESYASQHYNAVKELKLGETKIVEDTENKQLLLFLKKDIMADGYYLNNMYDYIINLLKYDDFSADCEEKSLELEFEQNKFATGRFNVKKLKSGQEA